MSAPTRVLPRATSQYPSRSPPPPTHPPHSNPRPRPPSAPSQILHSSTTRIPTHGSQLLGTSRSYSLHSMASAVTRNPSLRPSQGPLPHGLFGNHIALLPLNTDPVTGVPSAAPGTHPRQTAGDRGQLRHQGPSQGAMPRRLAVATRLFLFPSQAQQSPHQPASQPTAGPLRYPWGLPDLAPGACSPTPTEG